MIAESQNLTSTSIFLSPLEITKPLLPASPHSDHLPYIFVKDGKKYEKLLFSDIVFIKAAGSYCEIKTVKRNYTLTANMKSVLLQINSSVIIRCHRGYAVNLERINSFDDSMVELDSSEAAVQLPVSLGYRSDVLSRLPRLKSC